MSKKAALKPKTWAEFNLSLPDKFTPVPNRRLDALVRDTRLTLEERFDALLLRTSLGNWNEFACSLVRKSQSERKEHRSDDPRDDFVIKPLLQVDFARILKVDLRRINDVVVQRRRLGYLEASEKLNNPRLLVPILDPPPAAAEQSPPRAIAWRDFSKAWDAQHPELVAEAQQAQTFAAPYLERIERIRRQKLADFKAAQKVPHSPDFKLPDEPDSPPPGPELPGEKVRNSPEKLSATPRSVSPSASHGHDIDPRAHADLNIKQETVGKSSPSVGRSFVSEEPTDRPTGAPGPDSPYKAKVRDWLESHVKLPTRLMDPELHQIASTIQTETHFEQFQQAARRGFKSAKGWRYFVKVALDCQQHQEKYAAAAAASGAAGDSKEKSAVEEMLRMRKEVEENERSARHRNRHETGS